MNPARHSFAQLLALRIQDRPEVVVGAEPIEEDRKCVDVGHPRRWARWVGRQLDGFIGREAVIEALNAGALVGSRQQYGTAYVWRRTRDGVFRGELLQYRELTENEIFTDANAAAAWLERMYIATQ